MDQNFCKRQIARLSALLGRADTLSGEELYTQTEQWHEQMSLELRGEEPWVRGRYDRKKVRNG